MPRLLNNDPSFLGKIYYNLKIIDFLRYHRNSEAWHWICECKCGKSNIIIYPPNLKSGHTKSCGCEKNVKHGMCGTRIYRIWQGMHDRCYSINAHYYKDYGARGITVCDEWKNNFNSFYNWAINNGYSELLTLERLDVNGNYSSNNCTWATRLDQARNHRKSSNNKSGYAGVSYHKETNKWRAYITANHKQIHLGLHDTIESAAKARRDAETKYWNK